MKASTRSQKFIKLTDAVARAEDAMNDAIRLLVLRHKKLTRLRASLKRALKAEGK